MRIHESIEFVSMDEVDELISAACARALDEAEARIRLECSNENVILGRIAKAVFFADSKGREEGARLARNAARKILARDLEGILNNRKLRKLTQLQEAIRDLASGLVSETDNG